VPTIRRYWLILVLAGGADAIVGAAAWHAHVAAIDTLLDAQSATVRAFVASAAHADAPRLLEAVARPEVDVLIHGDDVWLDYVDGATRHGPPQGPPPGERAPPANGPPPRGTQGGLIAADLAHVPPRTIDAPDYSVTLVASALALTRFLYTDVAVCTAVFIAFCILASLASDAIERAARRPLERTTLALEALAAGNFTPQTVEPGDAGETARLARAYNAAAETVARSIEERRVAASEFQRFLADAGHELRTPLTIVSGYIDILAAREPSDDTERRVIDGMQSQTARLRGMVEKMLLLSRLESTAAAPRAVSVASVARDVAETMRDSFSDRRIDVRCDADASIFIDEDDLYEAQRNLVENALRYAPGSAVDLRAAREGASVRIDVKDSGPGIPAEEQAMVFERFYRGKERKDSAGSGLGLAIVRRIAERWGGSVALRSDANGTLVTMRFPATEAAI
jgi:two-component system, OmpR family, sensor kinase